jgi:pyruvate,orthophosphate dikinase
MDCYPVVIRTLDPPLNEFLPKRGNLMVDVALLPSVDASGRKESASSYNMAVKDLKKAGAG